MSYFCFILNYWYCYWYWIFNTLIAVTASFGISLITYSLLIFLFDINQLVGSLVAELCIDSFGLLAAILPIKSYSNAEDNKGKILSENQNKSGIYM